LPQGSHEPSSSAPRQDPFVVEFVGAPGAGKTTLALAVAAALRASGATLSLAMSTRPGELPDGAMPRAPARAIAVRIARAIEPRRRSCGPGDAAGRRLLFLMPLANPVARARRRRYLARLDCEGACDAPLLLRDQGYLCAVAGLALDAGCADQRSLGAAIRTVPLPDLAIRPRIPDGLRRERLLRRLERQSWAERLLERSPDESVALEAIFDLMEAALGAAGCPVFSVPGDDVAATGAAVAAIRQGMLRATVPRKVAQW